MKKVFVLALLILFVGSLFAASQELINAAKEEGKVTVYSITSRIANAAEAFQEKYGIEVEAYNLHDYELIEKVSKEVQSGISGADFVIAQDSGRVFGELLDTGYVYSVVPEALVDVIPEEFQDPLVFTFISKVFCYNSQTFLAPPAFNIWALADPAFEGQFFFKDPFQEGVNMNFLTMITDDYWSAKIAQAYEDYYGEEIELTTENAGYEWIKAVLENGLVLFGSDTKMAESIGVKDEGIDAIGLFAYTKVRYRDTKDLALMPIMAMEPFAGFYYPSYLLMVKNVQHPNAAKLFMEFLYTEEGFEPWNTSEGTYCANPEIKVYPGDNTFEVWKLLLVGEDGEYIFYNRADVEDFWGSLVY